MIHVTVNIVEREPLKLEGDYAPSDSFSALAREVVKKLGHNNFCFCVSGDTMSKHALQQHRYHISAIDMKLDDPNENYTFQFIQEQECGELVPGTKDWNWTYRHNPVSNWLHFDVVL